MSNCLRPLQSVFNHPTPSPAYLIVPGRVVAGRGGAWRGGVGQCGGAVVQLTTSKDQLLRKKCNINDLPMRL